MRHFRPQRRLFFAGCEGDSERAYVQLLNNLAEQRGLHIAIRAEPLNPGAGDPYAIMARAVERLAHRRKQGALFQHVAVFLDSDTSALSPERTRGAEALAAFSKIQLIWQRPNHEAVLLRHLDGCLELRPDAARSLAELKKRWPEYDKSGISAEELSRRIDYPQIVQAANTEPELRQFLRIVGLL